eukprot:scaffold629_cov30-Tisochrysis_lutea.AAC.2
MFAFSAAAMALPPGTPICACCRSRDLSTVLVASALPMSTPASSNSSFTNRLRGPQQAAKVRSERCEPRGLSAARVLRPAFSLALPPYHLGRGRISRQGRVFFCRGRLCNAMSCTRSCTLLPALLASPERCSVLAVVDDSMADRSSSPLGLPCSQRCHPGCM